MVLNFQKILLQLLKDLDVNISNLQNELMAIGPTPGASVGNLNLMNDGIVQPSKVVAGQHPENESLRLLANVLASVKRPDLGLDVGRRMDVHQLGVFGYALLNSPTGADALKLLLQYQRIVMPHLTIELRSRGGEVAIVCLAKHLSPVLERFSIESFFVSVRNCSQNLLGFAPEKQQYFFDYSPPDYQDRYSALLGDEIYFDAGVSEVVFSSEVLNQAIGQANPINEAVYLQQCDVLLKQLGGAEPVSAQVQQLLLRGRGAFPSIGVVATQMNMSESTLRRKLRAEKTGFQKLLDQVREHLAQQYLQTTQLSVAEVGRLLGFDDVANFRRAFKTWSGRCPNELRSAQEELS